MTTARDLKSVFSKASAGESFYWFSCDGHCSGTEFTWLPVSQRWVYLNRDSGGIGVASELTLILSDADGDESGLNNLADMVSCEFEGGPGLWVLDADLPEDFELPEDAEVFTVADPTEGIKAVALEQA